MMKYVRSLDRDHNLSRWPALYYPELYVMAGGYKAFYKSDSVGDLCSPYGYVPMLHVDFASECTVSLGFSVTRTYARTRKGILDALCSFFDASIRLIS